MDGSILTPVITGIAGVIVASSIALVRGAIASRGKENEELRTWRLKAYPAVWKLTSTVPRWPRSNATYQELWSLHYALRDWYYNSGGLYLSENARARYGDMQELLDAYLDDRARDDDAPVPRPASGMAWAQSPYKALMDACSAFRTGLTEDLSTRRSRSILWAAVLWRRHQRQRHDAADRLAMAIRLRSVEGAGTQEATISGGVTAL